MTDAQTYNAKRQGRLEGLREAARLVCEHCDKDVPRISRPSGIICHGKAGDQAFPWCSAGSIHDRIAREWGTGKPEPATDDQDTVRVCASCLRASCFEGDFHCENYRQADITVKTLAELRALAREHPDYWRRKQAKP